MWGVDLGEVPRVKALLPNSRPKLVGRAIACMSGYHLEPTEEKEEGKQDKSGTVCPWSQAFCSPSPAPVQDDNRKRLRDLGSENLQGPES